MPKISRAGSSFANKKQIDCALHYHDRQSDVDLDSTVAYVRTKQPPIQMSLHYNEADPTQPEHASYIVDVPSNGGSDKVQVKIDAQTDPMLFDKGIMMLMAKKYPTKAKLPSYIDICRCCATNIAKKHVANGTIKILKPTAPHVNKTRRLTKGHVANTIQGDCALVYAPTHSIATLFHKPS